jgi:hypothetical protein
VLAGLSGGAVLAAMPGRARRRALQIMRACSTACGALFGSLSPDAPPRGGGPSRGPHMAPHACTPAAAAAPDAHRAPLLAGRRDGAAAAQPLHSRLRSFGVQPSADVGAVQGMVPMVPLGQ